MMKNLPAIQETWGRSLGGEDTLETGITTHFSILAWWIPWTEEPSRLQSMGSQRVRHDWVTNTFTFFMKEKGGNDYLMKKKVKVKLLSRIRLFATPWTVAHQAPPSMGFSRQEYWSGLPFPSPGNLPDPEIGSRSPALQADALTSEPPGKPTTLYEWWVLRFSVYHNTADYKMKIIHNTAEFDFKIFYGLKNQLVPTPNTLLI